VLALCATPALADGGPDGGADAGDAGAAVDAGDAGAAADAGDAGDGRDAGDAADAGPDAGDAGLDAGDGDDAGPTDAGATDSGVSDSGTDAGYDAGYDAGPKPPPGEGFFCTTATPDCEGDLLCVPYPSFPEYGTCRAVCDDEAVDAGCFAGRTCQSVVDRASLAEIYSVCSPPTSYRDGDCQAPLDPDACTDGRECLVTRPTGDVSINCKDTCDLDTPVGADAGCAVDERCFASTVVQEVQLDNADQPVTCTPARCDEGGSDCECNEGAGFSCVETLAGFVCGLLPGQCGTPIAGLTLNDLTDAGYVPTENLCNAISGHTFCDNEPYEDLDNPGANVCAFEGLLQLDNAGLCLPFCGNATFDDDNDGMIDPDEVEPGFDCPDGMQCTRRLARELLLGPGPQSLFGPFGLAGCDPAVCPPALPCPDCGPGEVECMLIPDGPEAGSDGVCIAPLGTCDRPPAGYDDGPRYDAGPPIVLDAGVVSDAAVFVDAGYDAGGEPPRLGGDRGPGVPRETSEECACAHVPGADRSPAAGTLALLVSLALLRRRRGDPRASVARR
jgi:hypothetical protein